QGLPAADERYAAYYQGADDETAAEDIPADQSPAEEPPRRLGGAKMPARSDPPTPVMEDDFAVETAPESRFTRSLVRDTVPTDAPFPSYGAFAVSASTKGWGYSGGCCADVWDGYCEEQRDCHA